MLPSAVHVLELWVGAGRDYEKERKSGVLEGRLKIKWRIIYWMD